MLTFSDFIEFLYKKKCLLLYFDNINKEFEQDYTRSLKLRVRDLMAGKPNYFISNAFCWENSNEGFDFWLNIGIKWLDLIDNER